MTEATDNPDVEVLLARLRDGHLAKLFAGIVALKTIGQVEATSEDVEAEDVARGVGFIAEALETALHDAMDEADKLRELLRSKGGAV